MKWYLIETLIDTSPRGAPNLIFNIKKYFDKLSIRIEFICFFKIEDFIKAGAHKKISFLYILLNLTEHKIIIEKLGQNK